MAMKDILGRFKREPDEESISNAESVSEEAPVSEKPSFVFTDINSEPIGAASTESVSEAANHNGPVKVGSSDNGRIQMFELDLGGSKVKLPEEPAAEVPVIEEPVYETYTPSVPTIPEPEDTIVVAPTPDICGAEEDYEVDFGYSAPGALDDVTYTTDPASVPKPAEPEPITYTRSEAPADNDDEYYDSYEPMFEESYGPGTYFSGEPAAAAAPIVTETVETPVYDAPKTEEPEVAEPVKVYDKPTKTKTYKKDRPRYENYREDYQNAPADEPPRTYENNIDDSVFLPDEGESPMSSRRNRRRLTIAILAVLAALLLCLGGILISHFVGRSRSAETATTAKVKTTAFERSVSNNASATTTTVAEEEETVQYDENGQISSSTEASTASTASTSRRTSTRTTTSRSTTTTTTRSTATTTRSTTASTTRSTAPATTTPSTAVPSTDPTPPSTTAAPSPWDHVNG